MASDPALAEELTQDVFVRAWQKLASFQGRSAFSSWLYPLAVNVALSERRSRRRRTSREVTTDDLTPFERPDKPEPPDSGVDLERAMASLPPGARAVFVLHDVEGYRHEEIANMTGMAEGTSKAQLHRARKLLRERLGAMTCGEALDRLDDFVDGTLPDEERLGVESHLRLAPRAGTKYAGSARSSPRPGPCRARGRRGATCGPRSPARSVPRESCRRPLGGRIGADLLDARPGRGRGRGGGAVGGPDAGAGRPFVVGPGAGTPVPAATGTSPSSTRSGATRWPRTSCSPPSPSTRTRSRRRRGRASIATSP